MSEPHQLKRCILPGDPRDIAPIALIFDLHEGPGGTLMHTFEHAVKYPSGYWMALDYDQDKPVGVAVIRPDSLCMVYMKPASRNTGRGERLVRSLIVISGLKCDALHAWYGNLIGASRQFWKRIGIPLAKDLPPLHPYTPGVVDD